MATRTALLAILILAALAAVSAHSWLDCADWRFNDPAALTNPSLRRWSDADGKCFGHARRFEVTQKPFGKMDETQFFRHYVQKFESGALACRNNAGSSSSSGSSEGVLSPRSLAYAPNKNPSGLMYGTMAQVRVGQTLCWRWPAKNHFAHVNRATTPLFVNWDTVANRAAPSLTQAAMDGMRLTDQTMLWADCPVPGPPSNGDSSGTGSELRACGGCFKVPQRAPGIYTVQWQWPFKNANSETYTSCADIEVLASATTTVNCAVSAWSAWGTCSSNCGSGAQTRTRTITTNPTVSGTPCPTLREAQACNTQSCSSGGGSAIGVGISAHVVYENSLVQFTDWSWAAKSNYNLASTTRARSGTAISWTPTSWQAIYFNSDIGRVSVQEYQSISFYINGGTSSGQQITFSLVTTGRTSSPLFTYPIPTSSIRANTWTKVEIVFANLRLTSANFDGFWFQANSGNSQPTVHIDDIYFMHVHAGGPAATITTDPCESVSCTGNSACLGGQCYCTNGYYGIGCTTAGSITSVSVKTLADLDSTVIEAGATYLVSWTANGTLPILTVMLFESGSSIPTHLATQVPNQGYYTWMVPETLARGTYTVRVAYSRSVYGESPPLTKSTDAVENGCGSCNGHGTCDEDTAPACVCRYGYTGDTCSVAPDGVTKTRVSIVVGAPIELYQENGDKFQEVLKADLGAALFVETDQIEIVSVEKHTADTSLVTYDLVTGGGFVTSTLAIRDEATYHDAIAQQLATADSSIHRGTYTYAAVSTDAASAASSLGSSTSVRAVSALALAAAAAIAF